ncbi:dihydrofolate reductase family protein [Catenulispora sp. NF23]|uniref:Dihydrofolate reductase family protein n=1 Tax=Catenulispora pinistramenti TaxID=2705254 RepID=A0ABS5KX22_9ACTN|nr:dihydrofolate reductase family protein [Catenulispora pinistramenti]MBS2536288.1 dihydrofolate reductase family protein [Catenulispora pinistramenti]MBS2550555.1 dihydrofolate reductase family protein [Catenulispora pinistramenti]
MTSDTSAPIVRCDMSISIDGFTTGLEAQKPPYRDDRFHRVTRWVFADDDTSRLMTAERVEHTGAYVMGRRMYDSAGDYWNVESPYKTDVFVVTHRPRETVKLDDGTVFHFVTEGGVPAAIRAAGAACPDGKRVHLSGGAKAVQQALAADLVDELHLHVTPVLIGQGTRLFDGLPDRLVELEPLRVIDAAGVTHLSFRLPRSQRG